jgi:hypothetical protein
MRRPEERDGLTGKFIQLVELGLGVELCLFSAVGPGNESACDFETVTVVLTSTSTDPAGDGDGGM